MVPVLVPAVPPAAAPGLAAGEPRRPVARGPGTSRRPPGAVLGRAAAPEEAFEDGTKELAELPGSVIAEGEEPGPGAGSAPPAWSRRSS
ncbi:hypothetical protein [Streptomyces sp. STD57]|uniref:hypothetical protein n=1 Tax=Streptomyces sp. STD57 TaxID=3231528 RepID=UPI00345C24F9